jgi:hypothetical protein
MMMSMAGKKGSMVFSRSRRDMAILPTPPASSMVRCVRVCGLKPLASGLITAHDVKAFGGSGLEWFYL